MIDHVKFGVTDVASTRDGANWQQSVFRCPLRRRLVPKHGRKMLFPLIKRRNAYQTGLGPARMMFDARNTEIEDR